MSLGWLWPHYRNGLFFEKKCVDLWLMQETEVIAVSGQFKMVLCVLLLSDVALSSKLLHDRGVGFYEGKVLFNVHWHEVLESDRNDDLMCCKTITL